MVNFDENYDKLINEKFKNLNLKIDNNQKTILDILNRMELQSKEMTEKILDHDNDLTRISNKKESFNTCLKTVEGLEEEIDILKKNDITHYNNCPNNKKIANIEKELEAYRVFKTYPKLFFGNVIFVIIITLIAALKVFGIL